MLDFIYHMTLKLLKMHFWRENVKNLPSLLKHYNGCHYVILKNL